DPFDNLSSVEYDDFQLFPIKATDALGLETVAEYDYRVMQADKVTDPNENISVFDFSPLGLLKLRPVMVKVLREITKAVQVVFMTDMRHLWKWNTISLLFRMKGILFG